jgi:hypothetical protein
MMENTVWYSRIMRDYRVGLKQGLAIKYFGRDWDPPTFMIPPSPEGTLDLLYRYQRGEPLPREAFPETAYVFDWKRFGRAGDLFTLGPFFAVRGKLAEVLSRFDLGQGGLIPFPIYREDKTTQVPGEFYIWKLGAQKDGFLPDQSRKVKPFGTGLNIVEGWWDPLPDVEDDDIAVSAAAVAGPPDVWCDPKAYMSLFFSDALVAAIGVAKIKTAFEFRRCRLL